jgi:muconolactone D-isomerase
MPEFLVRIAVALPDQNDDLIAAERAYGRSLLEDGTIVRIWRVPGTTGNVGIWSAPDATALHERLRALPAARWCEIEVTALATHPLEGGADV